MWNLLRIQPYVRYDLVQGTKCSIWDIVRRTKSKQVPSWDPRQHVECWGPFTKIESSRLDFQLSTSRDLVRWMGWTRHENRVQWTRFPLNSVSVYGNRVLWTRFMFHVNSLINRVFWTRIVINEISLRLYLTYNIVWVLWLFKKKTLL